MGKKIPYCEFDSHGKRPTKKSTNKTRFYKHRGNFTWQGIKAEKYKTGGRHWADVIRRVIIGNHRETAKFHLRYFEISPGGFTSFEKHKHEDVVIGIRGRGKVFCGRPESMRGGKQHEMNFLDTLYIAPDTPHQLTGASWAGAFVQLFVHFAPHFGQRPRYSKYTWPLAQVLFLLFWRGVRYLLS